jgi:tripartite-type tricarboxylate transporter receptor subunit TctC
MPSRRRLLAVGAAVAVLPAAAQDAYPTRPVRVIVPFPPGQASDLIARIVGEDLARRWRQPVVVENRSGGAGTIGAEAGARAAPDGYTITVGSFGPITVAPALVRNLGYDPVRDFAPVSNMIIVPMLILCHPSFPATTIQDLVAQARARPGDLHYASGGPGSTQHLTGELFAHMLGLRMQHVPYRGSAPAMTDLIAGTVPLMVDSTASALPHIQAGRIRALAVASRARLAQLPDVPTVAETVIPDFVVQGWTGLLMPAATPTPIIELVHRDVVAILRDPAVAERIVQLGAVPSPMPLPDFTAFVHAEVARWRKVVGEIGIRLDG